jgi:hypothetical protein
VGWPLRDGRGTKKITKKSNNNIERMNECFIIITKIAIPGPIIPVASGELYSR